LRVEFPQREQAVIHGDQLPSRFCGNPIASSSDKAGTAPRASSLPGAKHDPPKYCE